MKQSNHVSRDQNDNEYAQSWYPVSRSCDLKKGQHKPIKIFGLDWILFRTLSGKVSFLNRHCCHMGADLCQGKVNNETIECPLHAWQFDILGKCVYIPAYKKPFPERHVYHLSCKEKYGLIFVFWGNSPLFPVPSPPDIFEQQIYSHAKVQGINTSHQALSLNAFDTQHFKHVHNRIFIGEPDIYKTNDYAIRIDFEAKICKRLHWFDHIMSLLQKGNICISIECWGASLVAITNHDLKSGALVALQPVDTNHTKVYLVSIKECQDKPSLFDKLKLSIAVQIFHGFLSSDHKIIKNMHLHRTGLFNDLDKGARLYWDYFEALPRFNRR